MNTLNKSLIIIAVGLLFGFGLQLSGMTKPQVVLQFLNANDGLQIDLIIVLMTAIATVIILNILFKSPMDTTQIKARPIKDKKLFIGSILFGIGWGLSGLCPGTSIAALANFNIEAVIFVISLIVSLKLTDHLTQGNKL